MLSLHDALPLLLGQTCPSLYDMRNLFQVNVEEGRHLWAMVYLLDAYFGRDGREEAEALLQRRSGDDDKPRILGAFNEATPRSEEHTSELQSLMRNSYAVFCLKKKKKNKT